MDELANGKLLRDTADACASDHDWIRGNHDQVPLAMGHLIPNASPRTWPQRSPSSRPDMPFREPDDSFNRSGGTIPASGPKRSCSAFGHRVPKLPTLSWSLREPHTPVIAPPKSCCDSICTACGGGFDILINSAAIGNKGRIVDLEIGEYQKQMDVNVRAPMLFAKAAIPHLSPGGCIVNILVQVLASGSPSLA